MSAALDMSTTDIRLSCRFRVGRADTLKEAMIPEFAPEFSMLRKTGDHHAIILWPRMIMARCNFHWPFAG